MPAKKKTAKKVAKNAAKKQPAKKQPAKKVATTQAAKPDPKKDHKEEKQEVETSPVADKTPNDTTVKATKSREDGDDKQDAKDLVGPVVTSETPSFEVPALEQPAEKKFTNPDGPTQVTPAKVKADNAVKKSVETWVKSNTKLAGADRQAAVDRVYNHHRKGLISLIFMDGSGKDSIHLCEHPYEKRDRVRGASARFAPKTFLHEFLSKQK